MSVPDDFQRQMRQVAVLPLEADWFARHGVRMHREEIEPGWPLLHGMVKTDAGVLVVVGDPREHKVALWAPKDVTPQAAADALEATLKHGAKTFVHEEDALQ